MTAAIQARGETDLTLETINFQQAFDAEGQAQLIVVTRQGNDTHVAQARLVGFDEVFDGQTGLTQGVVQAQTHVIEIGQPVVGQRLHAAGPGAEHFGQMGSH
ncbi:hypothetical protein D3C81_1035090 [compost metagenome]